MVMTDPYWPAKAKMGVGEGLPTNTKVTKTSSVSNECMGPQRNLKNKETKAIARS